MKPSSFRSIVIRCLPLSVFTTLLCNFEMGEIGTSPLIWEEIDRSESYLVSSMHEEAASLASSILKRICNDNNVSDQAIYDMMESAGMVLVQSLKELGRAANIMNELKLMFESVTDIPVQVLLTGTCFQISEGSYFGVRECLEDFLSKWTYVDERCYVIHNAEKCVDLTEGCDGHFVLKIDQYMEVVEVYAVTLLGTVLNDVELAITWIEKAAIPEDKRQVLLRRLHSLYSVKATNMSQSSSVLSDKQNLSERSPQGTNTDYFPCGEDATRQTTLNLPIQSYSSFSWFRSSTLKFGNVQTILCSRKISLGFLICIAYYILRRKQATLKRIAMKQFLWVKKTLVDLWQLAFSYQVNPLAAVQPLPAASTLRGQ